MQIKNIKLSNIKSFENANVDLSPNINVFIGRNNSGKSTLARAPLFIQNGTEKYYENALRVGQTEAIIELEISRAIDYFDTSATDRNTRLIMRFKKNTSPVRLILTRNGEITVSPIPDHEPDNFIFPYLSGRKVTAFEENVNSQTTSSVRINLANLYAKVDSISNPNRPSNNKYSVYCKDVLGFIITSSSSDNGKKACYIVDDYQTIPIDSMGDGVPQIVGLLVDLCKAKGKLFIIEELENDIHPTSLKRLLQLIIESSQDNQFIITTHSNIVTRILAAQPKAKLFSVDSSIKSTNIFTSTVVEIQNDIMRKEMLSDLGYELGDFDLWEGWIFFEESSSEKIVREYLMPWFAPKLKDKIKTYASNGKDGVTPKVEAFYTLFTFLHLEPVYKNRAWVVLDSGESETDIVNKLKSKYSPLGWTEQHFINLSKHDFEEYYPEQFYGEVQSILALTDKKEKKDAKKQLLEKLEGWIQPNPKEAKTKMEISFGEIISLLKDIENQL